MKRLLCLFVCMLLLCSQVFAAEGGTAETLEAFFRAHGLDETNFSMSYYNLATGEDFAFNEAAFFPVGAVWTLPLHMHYLEQEAIGAFDPPPERPDEVFDIDGLTLNECRYRSIVRGDDEFSQKMRSLLGTPEQYQRLINEEFGHLDEQTLPDAFLTELHYSAAFLMNCLKEVSLHPETFGDLMQNYSLAQTDGGFAAYGKPYDLVQLLGEEDGMVCAVGRMSAPQPYLLVCFVSEEAGGGAVLAQLNALLCERAEADAQGQVPTVSTASTGRSDSDFIVSAPNTSRKQAALRPILYALGGAAGLGALTAVAVHFLRRRRDD